MATKRLNQYNPTLDKMGLNLAQAGASALGPILSGFPGRFTILLGEDESIQTVKIVDDNGALVSTPSYDLSTDGLTATVDIIFGADTGHGETPVRNHVVWETDAGVCRRHFWTKTLPSSNAIWVDNQKRGSLTFHSRFSH